MIKYKSQLTVQLLGIYVISIVIAATFYILVWSDVPIKEPDSQSYIEVAQDLKNLRLDKLHDRTIGYPLLLLITNSTGNLSRLIFYVQLGLHFSSILLILMLLDQLNVSRKFLIIFIYLGLLPPVVEPTVYILTETLTQFLLVLGMVGVVKWLHNNNIWWLWVSGIALALCGITRPTYQLLPIFLTIVTIAFIYHSYFLQLRKQLLKVLLILWTSSTVILGGYALYNYIQFDYFGITPLFGFNLSTKTARVVEQLPDQYAEERKILVKYRDKNLLDQTESNTPGIVHTGNWYIWDAIPELQKATRMTKAELSNHLLKLNIILILQEPLEYLREFMTSAILFWFPDSNQANFNSRIGYLIWSSVQFTIAIIFWTSTIFLISLASISKSIMSIKTDDHSLSYESKVRTISLIFMVSIVMYTMIVSAAIEVGDPRYRMSVELLIFAIIMINIDSWQRITPHLKQLLSNDAKV